MTQRSIRYAGSRDQVGVCHSQTHSFTLVSCLSPRDTAAKVTPRDSHARAHTAARPCAASQRRTTQERPILSISPICSNLKLIPPARRPGRQIFASAEGCCQSCNSCSRSARDKKRRRLENAGFGRHAHTRSSAVVAGANATPQIVMRSLLLNAHRQSRSLEAARR